MDNTGNLTEINIKVSGITELEQITKIMSEFAGSVAIADGIVTQLENDLNKFKNVDLKALKNAKDVSLARKNNAYANQAQSQANYTNAYLNADGARITAEAKKQNTRKTKRLEDFYETQLGQEKMEAQAREAIINALNAEEKMRLKLLDLETKIKRKELLNEEKEEKKKKREASKYDSSLGQSILYGLKGYEQKVAAQRNLTGYIGRGIGNLLKDSKIGNLFGGGITGKGLNLGITTPAFVIQGAKHLVDVYKKNLAIYGEIEALTTQLEVINGNPINAAAMFEDIKNYATKSPYGVTQVTEFSILLKQSGIYSKDVLDTMKKIGDVAGGNAEKMKRIANNYAQIQAAGKATTLDLRQFANAGVPIYKELRELLGVSQQELRSMTSEGKITSNVINDVFNKITSKGGIFYNATELGSKTYKAQTTNLKDVTTLALGKVGEAFYTNAYGVDNQSFVEQIIALGYDIFDLVERVASLEVDENKIKKLKRTEDAVINLKKIFAHIQDFPEDSNVEDYFSDIISNENLDKIKLDLTLQRGLSYKKELNKIDKQDLIITAYTDLFKELDKREGTDRKLLRTLASMFNKDIADAGSDFSLDNDLLMRSKETPVYLKRYIKSLEKQKSRLEKKRINNDKTGFKKDYIQMGVFDLSTYADYLEEYQIKNDKSNSKFNEFISQKYKETEDFKKKQEEEELNKIKEIRKQVDYSKQKGMTSENLSWMNGIKPEQAYELLKTHYTGEAFDFSRDLSKEDRNTFVSNMQKLREYSESVGTTIEDIYQIENVISAAKYDNIENIRLKLGKFKEYVDGIEDENLKNIFLTFTNSLEFVEIDESKLAVIEAELNKETEKTKEKVTEDIVPFWKRTISSIMGIPIELMQDINKNGFNGSEIINKVAKNKYARDMNKTLSLALLNDEKANYSLKDVASLIRYDSRGNINQERTRQNFAVEAMSMNTSIATTQAYQSSLQNQLNAIHQLFAEGFTRIEDLDKLKSEEYQKAYGYTATEADMLITAFSNRLREASDGTKSFQETTMQALDAWELETDAFLSAANSMILYKQTIEDLNKETEILKIQFNKLTTLDNKILEEKYGENYEQTLNNIPSILKGFIEKEKAEGVAFPTKMLTEEEILNFAKDYNTDTGSSILKKLKDKRTILSDEEYMEQEDSIESYIKAYERVEKVLKQLYNKEFIGKELDALTIYNGANSEIESINDKYKGYDNTIRHPVATFKNHVESRKESIAMSGYGITNKEEWKEFVNTVKQGPELQKEMNLSGENIEEQLLGKGFEFNFVKTLDTQLHGLKTTIADTFSSELLGQFNSSLELIGSNLAQGKSATDGLSSSWKEAGKSILSSIGPAMTTAGFNIAAAAATSNGGKADWGKVIAGLSLAAAGGIMSFSAGLLSVSESNDSDEYDDGETEKIQNLKDALSDLIDQAKTDAEYYQKHYLHKKALAENYSISVKHVNDAIITPKGQIVSTHPDDYLIATKTPHTLLSQGNTSSPTVNFTVINNAGSDVKIEQKQKKNEDGTMDIQAVITKVVASAVASGKLDGAFTQRDSRLRGRVVNS